jgi:hypothetical protein
MHTITVLFVVLVVQLANTVRIVLYSTSSTVLTRLIRFDSFIHPIAFDDSFDSIDSIRFDPFIHVHDV